MSEVLGLNKNYYTPGSHQSLYSTIERERERERDRAKEGERGRAIEEEGAERARDRGKAGLGRDGDGRGGGSRLGDEFMRVEGVVAVVLELRGVRRVRKGHVQHLPDILISNSQQ